MREVYKSMSKNRSKNLLHTTDYDASAVNERLGKEDEIEKDHGIES